MNTLTRPGAQTLHGQVALTLEDVASIAGVTTGTASRWMRDKKLPADRPKPAFGCRRWLTQPTDLANFLAERNQPTVHDIANELGWTYHQVWTNLPNSDPRSDRLGNAIRLSSNDAANLRATADRLAKSAQTAIPIALAANRTHLAVLTIETLIRQGVLETIPNPDSAHQRHITLASLENYEATHRPVPRTHPGDLVIPIADARRTLNITRPCMTHLVTSGQLTAATLDRRQVITLTSALNYLTEHPHHTCTADNLRTNATPMPA